jgi:hypothetical protein
LGVGYRLAHSDAEIGPGVLAAGKQPPPVKAGL